MLTHNRHLQEMYRERRSRRILLYSGVALNVAAFSYGVVGLLRRGGDLPPVGFLAAGVALFFLIAGIVAGIRVSSDLETFYEADGESTHDKELLALGSMAVNGMLGLPALMAFVLFQAVFPPRGG